MTIKHKVAAAQTMLRNEGLGAVIAAVLRLLKSKLGPYKPDECLLVFKMLRAQKASGLMIDVGAHYGGALSEFAHNGWRVFAFEPDTDNRKVLQRSHGSNPNVIIDERAVSDKVVDKVAFYRSAESTGISGLSSFHESHEEGDSVGVTTLTEYLTEKGALNTQVDFLKIDTEGYELSVLKGYPWLDSFPRVIVCEFEDSKTTPLGYDFHDLASFLVNKGYQLIVSEWFPIERYGADHRWRKFSRYPCELSDDKAWGNIIAVKDDSVFDSALSICRV